MGVRAVPRYGFTAIDIFKKKGVCIPIRTKVASETTEALQKTFAEIGYPTSIMCDEGGEFQGEFAQEAAAQDVRIIKSRTGGRFVERYIRTLKLRIFERKKALGGLWTKYVQHIVDQYNDSLHASIHAKPDYVASHEYDTHVIRQAHDWMLRFAKFHVKHEALRVGDFVKIRIKSPSLFKETFNSWSPQVYKIETVNETTPEGITYHLEGYRRPLLRYDLKKIEDVQRLAGGELRSVLDAVRHPPVAPHLPAPQPAAVAAPIPVARIPAPHIPVPRPLTRSVTRAAIAAASKHGSIPDAPEIEPIVAPVPFAPVPRPLTRSVARAVAASASEPVPVPVPVPVPAPIPVPVARSAARVVVPVRRPMTCSQARLNAL